MWIWNLILSVLGYRYIFYFEELKPKYVGGEEPYRKIENEIKRKINNSIRILIIIDIIILIIRIYYQNVPISLWIIFQMLLFWFTDFDSRTPHFIAIQSKLRIISYIFISAIGIISNFKVMEYESLFSCAIGFFGLLIFVSIETFSDGIILNRICLYYKKLENDQVKYYYGIENVIDSLEMVVDMEYFRKNGRKAFFEHSYGIESE